MCRYLALAGCTDRLTTDVLVWLAGWTHSHPLFTEAELEDRVGVKRAAIRKLEHELGIPTTSFDVHDLKYVSTVLYKVRRALCLCAATRMSDTTLSLVLDILWYRGFQAASCPNWTEYEMDHILLVRADVTLDVNASEVAAVEFVRQDALASVLADPSRELSPWFRLIATKLLPTWWVNLDTMLAQDSDDRSIHDFR